MNAHTPIPAPYSVPQLAQRWGCSEGLVRKLIRDGQLQCFRPGSLIRIAAAEVERFECQQMTMPIPSNDSEEATPSSGGSMKTEENVSADASNCRRQIGRARRRKLEKSGPSPKVVTGPWAGS